MLRAQLLRQETAVNSISPERAGSIMYDTLAYINQMQLQDANPLLISKIYASVAAMEADSAPVSDLTGQPLRPGQVVCIVTDDDTDPDYGMIYRYDGTTGGASSWTACGKLGSFPYGYFFKDVATPATNPGTPDGKVFYIASTPGTYANFVDSGNNPLVVNDGEVAVLKYDTAWSKEVTGAVNGQYIYGGNSAAFDYAAGATQMFEVPVSIKQGDEYTILAEGTSEIGLFRVFVNATGTLAVMAATGKLVLTASDNISKLIFYVRNATSDGTLNVLIASNDSGVANLIMRVGAAEKAAHTFSGAANIKVADIAVAAGEDVQVKIKTDKPFTRLALGFNGNYQSRPQLYQNFFKSDTIDVTFRASVALNSFWLYLISAEDLNITAECSVNTGAFISGSGSDKYDGIVSVPSRTYAMDGTENSIYHRNWLKYMDGSFVVAPESAFNANGWKFLDRCIRATAKPTLTTIRLCLRDVQTLNQIGGTIGVSSYFGSPAIVTPKNVNIIGDSFTYNGTFYQHIADITTGLSFVGMRKSYATNNPLRAEGRGGWTLDSYFQPHDDVTPTHMQPFSPFLHPAGYTYYGVIDFWKVIVNNNSQYPYGTNGFADYAAWFDSNGYKLNPASGDLMYDGVNDKYVYYNGSAWVDYSGTPDFVFDYAKYVATWQIASPDIVVIMLGKNDFQASASPEVFNAWKTKMDVVIASIQAYAASASKSPVIGICTPAVANEAPNNSDNNSPEVGGRNMWLARKQMIDYYDTDAFRAAGVYLVDSGVCLDPLYGFEETSEKPFEWYAGDVREPYATNGVHPSTAGYKQIGTCIAGFIQTIRQP